MGLLVAISLIVCAIAVAVVAIVIRALLFLFNIPRIGAKAAASKYGLSFLLVLICTVNTAANVSAFSWKRLGFAQNEQLLANAISYAYGVQAAYEQTLAEHFSGFQPSVRYFFSYSMSSEEYTYEFWDKVFGDDTYQVLLPEWRILLDKHGTPYKKLELRTSEQPPRINNLFGIVAYIEDKKTPIPILTNEAHLNWQSGKPEMSVIKDNCVAFLTTSQNPRVAVYSTSGTDFKHYVAGIDTDTYGYGMKLLVIKRSAVEKTHVSWTVEQRILTRAEFDSRARCD